MKRLGTFLLLLISIAVAGQYNQQRLFPELEGNELLDQVVEAYKADILFFDYGTSRDTMFRNVYAVNDSLSCVYSGHTLYMDPSKDPTTTVFMNGADNGINTEHTYPQSKGAKYGNARSDMHHLYPSRAQVNEERSNFPFGEINDNEATKWFYKDQTLINKPNDNLDKYSEWKWQVFEPRESHKGNVARAMMYFYTMYKSQADNEDPDFFWDMLPTLCDWHFMDPVDSAEYERTNLIAKWQQYPNPFVLDCSLAARSYCDIVNDACELAVPIEEIALADSKLKAFYSFELGTIHVESPVAGLLQIFDMNGRKMASYSLPSNQQLMIATDAYSAGNYVLQLITANHSESKLIYVGK